MRAFLVLVPILALAACSPSDQCVAGESRCSGNHVEICGPDRAWVYQENCDTIAGPNGGLFACQAFERDGGDTVHACAQTAPITQEAGLR
jgi:hypothetical protein